MLACKHMRRRTRQACAQRAAAHRRAGAVEPAGNRAGDSSGKGQRPSLTCPSVPPPRLSTPSCPPSSPPNPPPTPSPQRHRPRPEAILAGLGRRPLGAQPRGGARLAPPPVLRCQLLLGLAGGGPLARGVHGPHYGGARAHAACGMVEWCPRLRANLGQSGRLETAL